MVLCVRLLAPSQADSALNLDFTTYHLALGNFLNFFALFYNICLMKRMLVPFSYSYSGFK